MSTKKSLTKNDVKSGDYFILSIEKGYGPEQTRKAMQVMECWPNVMTVKCNDGCMTKEYDHFEKVTDLTAYKEVYHASYFEDNRS